jgi:hypothetical protein
VCRNIAYMIPLLIVTKFTYGFVLAVVSFNVTLTMYLSFSFSRSIADAKATLIVCVCVTKIASSYTGHRVRSRLPPAFHTYALATVALSWLVA